MNVFYLFFRIQTQPKLPNYSKNHAILFLHACYWDIKSAKSALEKYATIHATATDLFDNRDPMLKKIQQVFDIT